METINFGSFPRSGNHYFVDVASKLLVNTKVVWHEHKLFYLLKQKNAVTTIRDPIDAVHSLCLHTGEINQEFIDNCLRWYEMYYTKIKQANVLVVPFTKLIGDPSICFSDICIKYELNEKEISTIDVSTIQGKENYGRIAPESLIKNILNSKMLYNAYTLFDELCT